MGVRSYERIPARDLTSFNRTLTTTKRTRCTCLIPSRSLTARKYRYVYMIYAQPLVLGIERVFVVCEPPRMLLRDHSSRILRNPDKSRATRFCFAVNFVYFLQKERLFGVAKQLLTFQTAIISRGLRIFSRPFPDGGCKLAKAPRLMDIVAWILFARCIRRFFIIYHHATIISSRHDRINQQSRD